MRILAKNRVETKEDLLDKDPPGLPCEYVRLLSGKRIRENLDPLP